MKKVLLAGATGYLGSFIAKELKSQGYELTIIVRKQEQVQEKGLEADHVLEAQVTQPITLNGCCKDIDIVISTVGITRQKDGMTYDDVDYQANINLMNEAEKSGVKKFIYISAINAENMRELKICDAKERFVDALVDSGLPHCIIRPHGFFSDMTEFYTMAKGGRIYLFGDGSLRGNPIHGADLAEFVVNAIDQTETILPIGGPEFLSHREIAEKAFAAVGKPAKITCMPDGIRRFALKAVRLLTGPKTYGPIEFFLTVMAKEMRAPEYGKHTLSEYFSTLKQQEK
ncbi:MAG: SDR family oxidoreductase [Cellvibrionales bacterium]|nr:SDR family oxidoreductase [Cellvibrionales bacterium]